MSIFTEFKNTLESLPEEQRALYEKQTLADIARLRAFQHPVYRKGEMTFCRLEDALQADCLAFDAQVVSVNDAQSLQRWAQQGNGTMLLVRGQAGLSLDTLVDQLQGHPTLRSVFIEQAA